MVFKDGPMSEIREALQTVERHTRFLSQRVLETIITQQQEDETPSILTTTEMEIVKAIALGKTTKEIAAERFSSIHTVTTHRKNIFRKLGINTAHEAVKYALRAGLIDPSEFYI
jgi:DNA-binding NarL/FixJ family response regulator